MKRKLLKIVVITALFLTVIHHGAYSYVAICETLKADAAAYKVQLIADAAASIGYELPKDRIGDLTPEELAEKEALNAGINPALVRALITHESAWNPYAGSNKGAMGLMQIMPDTAVDLCGYNPKEMYEPLKNIKCGVKRLAQALATTNGNSYHAIQDYNGGAKCIGKCSESIALASAVHRTLAKDIR